ncbi:hypothetical protein PVAP13_6NG216212 [Panicum virgatum]|uniref:Uncharacterized protein n=1 Tax=Panicum virgatum TaxID=38727 RepID=A0A8T0R0Q6_PANVG|nr:hypothetical protein PVAP13_6NG216212 [Panicum virgatum]
MCGFCCLQEANRSEFSDTWGDYVHHRFSDIIWKFCSGHEFDESKTDNNANLNITRLLGDDDGFLYCVLCCSMLLMCWPSRADRCFPFPPSYISAPLLSFHFLFFLPKIQPTTLPLLASYSLCLLYICYYPRYPISWALSVFSAQRAKRACVGPGVEPARVSSVCVRVSPVALSTSRRRRGDQLVKQEHEHSDE